MKIQVASIMAAEMILSWPGHPWVLASIWRILARHACDRHTGIGADGFIAVAEDPLEMIYYNQDGSRAPMCGNGIRCFAAFCQDEGIMSQDAYDVQTLAGMQKVKVLQEEPFQVRIDMGMPSDALEQIGIESPIWGMPLRLFDGRTITLYSLFMGTIHTVVFVDEFAADLAEIGRQVCMHPLYAHQTNVNFVQVVDEHTMRVRTYERGCGGDAGLRHRRVRFAGLRRA